MKTLQRFGALVLALLLSTGAFGQLAQTGGGKGTAGGGGGGGSPGGAITWTTTGTSSTTASATTHAVAFTAVTSGQKLLLFDMLRSSGPDTPTADNSFTAPSGCSNSGGGGSWGYQTGPSTSTAFEKTASGSESGNATISWTNSSAAASAAFMARLSGANAGWQASACSSGAFTSTSSISVTGGTAIDFLANDLLIAVLATNNADGVGLSPTLTATGVTLGSVDEYPAAFGSIAAAGGNQGQLFVWAATVTSGSATVAPQASITWSEGTPSGSITFIRIRNNP